MSSATIPRVSVVVATLDRCHYLRLCLRALARQTAGFDAFEVIVVDNGSEDETPDVVDGFSGQGCNVIYVREERRGLSVARNTGVRSSRAAIVAFTDDDAVPDPQWVERIVARFETLGEDVAVIGGEVRPIWEAPRPDWLTNQLLRPLSAGLLWGPTARLLHSEEWLVEVNIAYRKSRLLEFGGFAEQLGRVGDTLLSCDGCVNLLFARAGLRAFYDPHILVGHHIHASRLTRGWFRRRYFWQGVSMNRVHKYLEEMTVALNITQHADRPPTFEEIILPTSAAAWADLFNDDSDTLLEQQVFVLEQLGYLLQSQSLITGR
ncbi:MAG: glycosyltransferase [Steroidobacteraceae bacterium]